MFKKLQKKMSTTVLHAHIFFFFHHFFQKIEEHMSPLLSCHMPFKNKCSQVCGLTCCLCQAQELLSTELLLTPIHLELNFLMNFCVHLLGNKLLLLSIAAVEDNRKRGQKVKYILFWEYRQWIQCRYATNTYTCTNTVQYIELKFSSLEVMGIRIYKIVTSHYTYL